MDSTECGKPKTEETTLPDSSEDNPKPSFTSSTYLESLGFVLTNGKPRFKLDESVTTSLNTNATTNTNFNIDDEDDLSFIVLGKNSMDTIQASSLASYVDIQQKSMSIDYNSMVSSLTGDEVQQKLAGLLQENMKLKETLKQNNHAMKQQFNTLATWQEEVMKVHQNHKQKFAETTEFINYLKKENAELKTKISTQQFENIEESFEAIHPISQLDINTFPNQEKLQEKIFLLNEQLSSYRLNSTKLTEDAEKYKNMFDIINTELTQANQLIKELESKVKELQIEPAMKLTNCNDQSSVKTTENQCSETCSTKDKEITRLKTEVDLLSKKCQSALAPIQLHDSQNSSFSENRQKFIQSMKQYNNTLQELTECFTMQIDRFALIENCLKQITEVLEILDDKFHLNFETIKSDTFSPGTQFHLYREKLCDCHKELVEEQIKIITDRQILIKSQNQFQRMLSDYNSILYELEITIDENAKLNALKDNITRDSSRKQAELEKTRHEKQSLEEEKKVLEEEKKLIEDQKKSLDIERKSLIDERDLMMQEKISLNEEKISLDHQSQLYEDQEKAFQEQKKTIQRRYEELLNETNILREDIQRKNIELKKLQQQSAEEINLLKVQLKLYEEDFKQEKSLKESLLEEKSKLDVELQKQVEFNKQLQKDVRILGGKSISIDFPSESDRTSDYSNGESTTRPCIKCNKIFTNVPALTEHIEKCLNLN